jgi:hypothetical protein
MDFERKFDIFQTRKNSHTGLLCITDPEYGVMTKKYIVLVYFPSPPTGDFRENRRLTPMDFERKIEFFQNP